MTSTLNLGPLVLQSPVYLCNTPQAYGALGDGKADDTTAITAWLAAVSANGGKALLPAGSYRVATSMTTTLAGTVIDIEGDGEGCSQLVFTGATDGITINLTRNAAGKWGAVKMSGLSIIRGPVSPVQASKALAIVVDSTQGVLYGGRSAIEDVFIGGSSQTSSWQTGLLLQDTVCCDLRHVSIMGPNATAAGPDIGISIVGTQSPMYSVQTDLTDCDITGFSCGLRATGSVQGVFLDGCAIIGNWWGVDMEGADAYAEALQISTSTFNATYRDVLAAGVGFVLIVNSTFIQFQDTATDWAAIYLSECNNCTVSGNQILGSTPAFQAGKKGNGIVIASVTGSGGAPSVVTGNVVNGVTGSGILLAGSGVSSAGSTVANVVATMNNCYAAAYAVFGGVAGKNLTTPNLLDGVMV
jgi:hypothetical protein